MKLLLIAVIAPLVATLTSCSNSQAPLTTVQNLELDRYDGEWHEVARLPNRFEKDIVAAKATYGVGLEGQVSVCNKGLKSNGEMTSISGSATVVGEGKLKVRFDPFPVNLFPGNYWILWINKSYTKAIVGSPNRKFLWLLSKDPMVLASDFTEPLQLIKAQGFEIGNLIENPKRLPPDPRPPLLVTF